MIPAFLSNGNLPPGIHRAGWKAFAARFGTTPRRQELLGGLQIALTGLEKAGCRQVYIDGSFVTSKPEPGDFDACWDSTGVDPERLDPVLLQFGDGRSAQKARFGGELFPAQLPNGVSGKTFLEFFQTDRNGEPKGIIQLNVKEVP